MEGKAAIGLVRPRAARHVCGCGGAHRDGAGAAAVEKRLAGGLVERKACERRGGEEGMRQARRSTVTEHPWGDV
jgi:hypothetical protein